MILAVKKDGTVYEVVGCDGLNPISILEDKSGKQHYEYDRNFKIVFADRQPELFKELLEKRA